MARKQSAGTLLYRWSGGTRSEGARSGGSVEVLIVHPSGNYNRRAPWSIPKGLPDEGESLEDAARRETREETGVEAGELTELGFVDYRKSNKRVFGFAGEAPAQEPRCASWEVDRAEFVPVDTAAERLHPDQLPFLVRLAELLAKGPHGGGPVAGSAPIP